MLNEIECLKSLSFPGMDQRGQNVEDAATGTCTWLLDHVKYRNWLAPLVPPQALLCIVGNPGAGKSTLVKFALREASHSNDFIASFFFSGNGVDLQKSSLGLFRSLLYQLIDKIPEMMSAFIPTYQKKRDTHQKSGSDFEWHERELRAFLKKWILSASNVPPIRFYVDALDEAGRDVAKELIQFFRKLTEPQFPIGLRLKVCLSCRRYPVLAPQDALKVRVEDQNHQDIAIYVRQNLKDHFLDVHKAEKAKLEHEIIERASCLFQWAVLVIPIIIKNHEDGASLRKIRKTIEKIPGILGDLYEYILSKIEDRQRAVQLMQWICFARRPLDLKELRFAMVVDITNDVASLEECQDSVDFAETDEQMRKTVTSLSGGLAETVKDENKQTVRFIHQSVSDYLNDSGLQNLDNCFFHDVNRYLSRSGQPNIKDSVSDNVVGLAHFRISRSCIKYLTSKEVSDEKKRLGRLIHADKEAQKAKTKSRFPFLQYAAQWILHAEIVEEQRIPQNDLLFLIRWPSEDVAECWLDMCDFGPRGSTLLGIASGWGLSSVVEAMINSGESFDLNSTDRWGNTSLLLAATYGHDSVVRQLLKCGGADINLKDHYQQTPLSNAAQNGHKAVVQVLVEQDGINVELYDSKGRTPLSWAIESGHDAVIHVLIEHDNILNCRQGRTPMIWAAERGHEAIVRLLIERQGVGNRMKDNEGRTPLAWAAAMGHKAAVQTLIEQDDNQINSKDNKGYTPLSWAVARAQEAVVRLLIKRDDIDINSKDNSGNTPLSLAARNGHEAIFRSLLEQDGVEINSNDKHGRTLLSYAADFGQEAMVRLLLKQGGVEINSKDKHGRTPLWYARENRWKLKNGNQIVIQLLEDEISRRQTQLEG